MNDILRRLGERIREIRTQRGFKSQEEFADYCKLHRTFIGHLETGRKDFRLTTIIRISEALGVTLGDLFDGLETGKRQPAKIHSARGDRELIERELSAMEQCIERVRAYTDPQVRAKKSAGARRGRNRAAEK